VNDDLHLPLGEGIIDFHSIFELLVKKGYEGTITLELEREVLESSRKKITQIVDDLREDLYDSILAHEREDEPREFLNAVKQRLRRKGKLKPNG
jgi:sugar phosphate isomerase/epimerase